jgi:hypothetical protein
MSGFCNFSPSSLGEYREAGWGCPGATMIESEVVGIPPRPYGPLPQQVGGERDKP